MPEDREVQERDETGMAVPLLDLKQQYQAIKKEIKPILEEICEEQYFILGPHVSRLEKMIAEYCHTGFALGVSSGTDALLLSLMTAGVGTGDLVLTTPYTFFATAGSIVRCGARPLFIDIEPATFNLDPEALSVVLDGLSRSELEKAKAVIPVHLYGQCAEMDPICELARANNLIVIEDAAQAIGAEYKGRRAGSMGDMGCFSFFPSKNLGAFGDGGMVTMHDEAVFAKMQMLRVHGGRTKYHHDLVGGNFRLDAIQAAVVAVKLKYLDKWTSMRRENAARYRKFFRDAGLEEIVTLPEEKQTRHIYNQFVISVKYKRDELKQYLLEHNIGVEVYYPVPLHLQPCFADLGYRPGDFPVAENAARSTLALPVYPELSGEQQAYVVERIKEFYA